MSKIADVILEKQSDLERVRDLAKVGKTESDVAKAELSCLSKDAYERLLRSACMYSPSKAGAEACAHDMEQQGITVAWRSVLNMMNSRRSQLAVLRDEQMRDLISVPISHRKFRLMKYQEILDSTQDPKIKMLALEKARVELNEWDEFKKRVGEEALSHLPSALRDEMDAISSRYIEAQYQILPNDETGLTPLNPDTFNHKLIDIPEPVVDDSKEPEDPLAFEEADHERKEG